MSEMEKQMKEQTKLSAHTVKVLEEVIESVKKAPEEKFDMWSWGIGDCGTAACAWEWWIRDHPRRKAAKEFAGSMSSFNSIVQYLKITGKAAAHLFVPEVMNETRREVIARIKRFIRTNGKSAEALS